MHMSTGRSHQYNHKSAPLFFLHANDVDAQHIASMCLANIWALLKIKYPIVGHRILHQSIFLWQELALLLQRYCQVNDFIVQLTTLMSVNMKFHQTKKFTSELFTSSTLKARVLIYA